MNNIDILKILDIGGDFVAQEIIKRSKDKDIIYMTEDTLLNTNCVKQLAEYIETLIAENKKLKEENKELKEFKENIEKIENKLLDKLYEDAQKALKEYRETQNKVAKLEEENKELKEKVKVYETECRRFKAFCKKIRKDEKHDVDLFNQGQEQKCNEFLNLIEGEQHWNYEGKYFDETDKQIEDMKQSLLGKE